MMVDAEDANRQIYCLKHLAAATGVMSNIHSLDQKKGTVEPSSPEVWSFLLILFRYSLHIFLPIKFIRFHTRCSFYMQFTDFGRHQIDFHAGVIGPSQTCGHVSIFRLGSEIRHSTPVCSERCIPMYLLFSLIFKFKVPPCDKPLSTCQSIPVSSDRTATLPD